MRSPTVTRLLVTGGGGAGAPLLWRFWHDKYEVHFADADPLSFSPEIPSERCHTIPKGGAPDFAEKLITLCEWLKVDLVIPAVDEELPIMPLIRRAGFDVLLPDEWYVHIMLDKYASMRELEKRGIPVPKTVIAKPRQGRGSDGVYVEQERLEGQEYTVGVMADREKQLRWITPVRVDYKRGITIRGELDHCQDVVDGCWKIHAALPAAGYYNVQGILTTDRGFVPFEINPRISTTTGISLAAGFDPSVEWLSAATLRTGDATWTSLYRQSFARRVSLSRSWLNTIRYT